MESAPTAVREGLRPSGSVYGGAGVRDDASIVPYTGLRYRKIAVSRLAAGPIRFAGNGLDRSAEPCTVATGPIWNRPLRRCGRGCGQAAAFMAGRGCGTMQASSPTRVCDTARLRFPGWPRAPSGLQGTVSTVPQGLAPRQPGRYGIGPYGGAGGSAAKGGVYGEAGGLRPSGGVYGGAGRVAAKTALLYPAQKIYARRRKLRAYILQDIGRGARFSAARLCGRFTGSPRRGGI